MLRTLYAKLALALFVLFVAVGASFFIVSLYSAYLYQQEVSQRLNRDLAMYIVDEHVRVQGDRIDTSNLKDLFHTVMVINPSLELYLLDAQGNIVAYSDELGEPVRRRVSLDAIKSLLDSSHHTLPIMGDDPKSTDGKKVFSAFPVASDGHRVGYIYAILGSERVEHISEMLQQSYIMRLGIGAIGAALLFAFIGGLVLFFIMTRRLRKLSQAMRQFQQQKFDHEALPHLASEPARDEIDAMALAFVHMARQIQQQMSRLQETDALRRELVANVSHDLRTPLASLKGYIETVLLKDDTLSREQRREYLQIAFDNSERLSKLVTELFELARLDAGELKLQCESFSLAELAHDVVQKFKLRAQQQHITLDVDIDAEVPYVEADIGLIERVLDNLVDNALKNTPQGGTIRLTLDCDGQLVTVQVADTGRGIAADELPHIFQRFYKKPDTDNNAQGGAGLGLAIAQRIVELHGSQLSVSSMLHQGTRFHFALPAQPQN